MRHYSDEYKPSPHEITKDNWRKSLGDARFCLAYRDFFNKELPTQGDWKKKFFELLLNDTDGPPLIDAGLCGLLHPIIHMDYAIELNNRLVACEALTMAAVAADSFQKLASKLQPPKNGTKIALQIMKEIRIDDDVPDFNKPFQMNNLLEHTTFLFSIYNEWKMADDLDKAIEELFDLTVYIYDATHKPDQIDFDFVLLHLLTGMNAIRTLRPLLDDHTVNRVLCSFFYLSLAIYISQQQPKINEHLITDYKVEENKFNWKYVIDKTLHTKLATEVHLVKVIRALKDAEADYGSKGGLYLITAVKSVDNLNVKSSWDYYDSVEPWIGTPDSNRDLNVKQ